jgi:hypothetical protein
MANIINRIGSSVVVHEIAGGSPAITKAGIQSAGETITAMNIAQVWWGTTGNWTVTRTGTILVLTETGHIDFAGDGSSLILNNTVDIDLTLTGTGYIMFELQKVLA